MIKKVILSGIALATVGVLLSIILDKFGFGYLGGIVIVGGVAIYILGGILFLLSLLAKLTNRRR